MDVTALLSWYGANRRRLPWREEVSPYRTLVSELMLQQTRVDTVIPYFERFMGDFPTVEALAAAPMERVLERWSGLGYYSRARNLHAAAKAVVERGGFPTDAAGLRDLPGVGPYTAGAVASIALGLDEPLVDGNVERVLSRWHAWERPTKASLWERAHALLPAGRAGDHNQALMELGATVCTPRNPTCLLCPVRAGCAGLDAPLRYPAPKAKKAVPTAETHAAVVRRDGHVLLARRPEGGLLGGLWELPQGPSVDAALARVGLVASSSTALGDVLHVFTHLRLTTHVHAVEVTGDAVAVDYPELRWAADVGPLALSTLARKTLAVAGPLTTSSGSGPSASPRTRRAPARRGPPA